MKVAYWGTYDKGKPRNRILLQGLRENGVLVTEYHYDLWTGVEDKSQIKGFALKLILFLRWLSSYPGLIYRFVKAPRHDALVVGYLGHLDVLIIWMFAKMKHTPIVWDAFISLYDTVVLDRKMCSKYNPLSWLLYSWEWLACRAADCVMLDTKTHALFFKKFYKLQDHKVGSVFVGAELEKFPRFKTGEKKTFGTSNKVKVLFYGQFIPLHGIETIFQAAQILENESVEWIVIGKGQEASRIRDLLDNHPLDNLVWKEWAVYEELQKHIHEADICLGIFGDSPKAAHVIPNKVYQVLASGKPLITRDSPAIKELLSVTMAGISLIPAASPEELAKAILEMRGNLSSLPGELHGDIVNSFTPKRLGKDFQGIIENQIC